MRWLVWVAALAACSFDTGGSVSSGGGDGGGGSPDAPESAFDARPPGTPDAAPIVYDADPLCLAPTGSAAGASCSDDGDCGGGANDFCLDEVDGWPDSGYCTSLCTNDAECGPDAACSDPIGDAGTRVCFANCCGGGACGRSGMACSNDLGGSALGFDACVPGNPSAGDGDPCSSFADCAPASVCSDNPFESPGGYCVTVGCTVGDDSTCAPGGDGACIDEDLFDGEPAICVDRCILSSDCRTDDGYSCEIVAIGVLACINTHRALGAACGSDSECGADPWECVEDSGFPNGYCGATGCTGDPDDCPEGAFCASVSGATYCIEPCTPGPVACRFIEGYECAAFTGGVNGCIDLDDL